MQGFVPYRLVPLTDEQMEQVFAAEITRLLEFTFGNTRPYIQLRIRQALTRFREDLEKVNYASILRSPPNPSYIRLAAHLDYLPPNIGDFFKDSIYRFMLSIQADPETQEAARRKIGGDVHLGGLLTDIHYVLEEFAWTAHTTGRRALSYKEVGDFDSWSYVLQATSSGARTAVLDEEKKLCLGLLAGRAPFFGVSHRVGDVPFYYFTHLGMQEYFSGMKLARQYLDEGDESLDDILGDKVHDTWWRQPILYMCSGIERPERILMYLEDKVDERFKADLFVFSRLGFRYPELRDRYRAAYSACYGQ